MSLRDTANTPDKFEGLSLSLEEIIENKKQQFSSSNIKALEERLILKLYELMIILTW